MLARPGESGFLQREPQQPGSQISGATNDSAEQRLDLSGDVTVSVQPQLRPDWRLEPNLTAQVRIAPTAMSKMLTLIPMSLLSKVRRQDLCAGGTWVPGADAAKTCIQLGKSEVSEGTSVGTHAGEWSRRVG